MGLFGPDYDTNNSLFSGSDNGMPGSNAPGGQQSNASQPAQRPQSSQGPSTGGSIMPFDPSVSDAPPSTSGLTNNGGVHAMALAAQNQAGHQYMVSQGMVPVDSQGTYVHQSMLTPDQITGT